MKEARKNATARIILAFGVIFASFGLGMAVAGVVFYELVVNLKI